MAGPAQAGGFECGYGPSGLPHLGTFGEVARPTMVRQAFRALTEDAIPTRLISFPTTWTACARSRQRAQPGDAARTRQAAHRGPRPVRRARELRRPQQRPPARLPRQLRLRVRVHLGERVLPLRPVRHDAAARARAVRRRSRRHAADPRDRSGGPPIRRSCRSARRPARCSRSRRWSAMWSAGPSCSTTRTAPDRGPGDRRRGQDAVAAGLGLPLDGAGGRLRDGRQGPDRVGQAVARASARCWAASRRRGSTTNSSWTRTTRRSRKSKGNGLTMEEWLRYGTPESLAYYMFQSPKSAKRLYFDVIPKAADEYLQQLDAYNRAPRERRASRAARQSGLARPPRRAAGRRLAGVLQPAAQPGLGGERLGQGHTVGLHRRAICRRDAGERAAARPPRPAMRSTTTRTSCGPRRCSARPTTGSARRWRTWLARLKALPAGCRRRGDPERGLRGRQGGRVRAAARLVLGPLRGAAGPDRGRASAPSRRSSA